MPLDECGGAGEGNKGGGSVWQDGLLTHTLDRLWRRGRGGAERRRERVGGRAVDDRWCCFCCPVALSIVAGEGWWAVFGVG